MEHVYSLKLHSALGINSVIAKGHKATDDSLLDLVPQHLHPSLQLVDWSHSGLIACSVNVSNDLMGGFGGGTIRQPVAAVFDCNEPQAVAILSAPEAASKRLQDSGVSEDDSNSKQSEVRSSATRLKGRSRGLKLKRKRTLRNNLILKCTSIWGCAL